MEQRRGDYVLTDELSRMDLPAIHRWLSEQAYWSLGRSLPEVTESFRQSSAYGVLQGSQQVGVARLVTDGVTFAYLCDVFVKESCRGQGIGSWMVSAVLADLRASSIPQVLLATRDAHAVYLRAGFRPLRRPERWLEIDPTADGAT
jgi:GNAT superfamily N-acetyltransferase